MTSIFERTHFIFKHDQNDSISIFGEDSTPLGSVTHGHEWKTPHTMGNIPVPLTWSRSTNIAILGANGEFLGGIGEVATGTMRLIRRWQVFDQNETFKGEVTEKPKFIGSDWVLKDVKENLLAVAEVTVRNTTTKL